MCTSNSTRSTVWSRPVSGRLFGGKLVRVVNTVHIFFGGFRPSPPRGHLWVLLWGPLHLPLCPFYLSSVIFHGRRVRCTPLGHVQTNPRLIRQHPPSRMTWLQQQAHYSGQHFGLLKDVMLSGLPWRARLCTVCQGHWKTMLRIVTQVCGSHSPRVLHPDNWTTQSVMCNMSIQLMWAVDLRFIFL